jgi:hypothetical protein
MYYLKIYYIKNIWEGMEVELSLAWKKTKPLYVA